MVVSCLELPNKELGLVVLKGNPLIQTLIEEQSCWNKVLDGLLREVIDIDKIQYGVMPRRGTIDVVFVLRRLNEKFRAKNKLFLYLLTWKRLLIRCQGKLFALF